MEPEHAPSEHPATLTLAPDDAIPAQDRRPLEVVDEPAAARAPEIDLDDESHLIRGYD